MALSAEDTDSKELLQKWDYLTENRVELSWHFDSSQFVEKREYLTYDSNDFLADVGGYLGLLLGHSVLTICDWLILMTGRLTKASCGRN